MNHLTALSDTEIKQVSGGKPSKIFVGEIYGGLVSDLEAERGSRFWSWGRYAKLFGLQRQFSAQK